ncbi:23S rRNA (adenine(2503)-C(2))-methyltransferase RlmN [Ruminococcaceae bacterium OttesenSCG-928-L11]|nr:23S rRNA (adenine(2503)-C(2))-methyltransferase RlmN [Ruminococcaceae bacterium OttesenSCG-928-L11]
MKRIDIKSIPLPDLTARFEALGQPKFRAKQVFRWIHQKQVGNFNEMSDLPLEFREKCNEIFYIESINIKKRLVSSIDGTVKYLYELQDGNTVEAVLMKYKHGNSLCISTQVGCRMGCAFCASTIGGLVRSLTAGEMLEEVYSAGRDTGEKVSSIVLMGIGEPLDNYDNVLGFLRILSAPDGLNLSLRHVSLSTCGLVEQIDLLAQEKLPLTLSVSLHAPNDAARNRTMPINRKYPVDELLAACTRYFHATGRRISFEYALIAGENDTPAHARELGQKLRGMNCHVNLIPVNPVGGKQFRASEKSSIGQFVSILEGLGVTTTVRRRLGTDINAACGQLRREDASTGTPH